MILPHVRTGRLHSPLNCYRLRCWRRFSTKCEVVRYKMRMLAKRSTKTTSLRGRYVTNRQGKSTGVVLLLKRYSRLTEDPHNLAVVAERRNESSVTADDMKKRLHRRGLL